ncbi:unnamed protein product, partial [marine sediment metagenome]
ENDIDKEANDVLNDLDEMLLDTEPVYVDRHSQIMGDDEKPEWDNFDPKKVQASIDAGLILPELKPRKNAVYNATMLTVP